MNNLKKNNIGDLIKSLSHERKDDVIGMRDGKIIAYGDIGHQPEYCFNAWRIIAGGDEQIQSRLSLYRPSEGLVGDKVATTDGYELHSRLYLNTLVTCHEFVRAKFEDKWYKDSFKLSDVGSGHNLAESHYQSKDRRKDHERILACVEAQDNYNLKWVPLDYILIDFLRHTSINNGGIWAEASLKVNLINDVLRAYSSVALDIYSKLTKSEK